MAREAELFRVEGPRGIYYAVYDAEQQSLFTEANEKGARDHAFEVGLTLSAERKIRHAELMRVTGREAIVAARVPEQQSQKPHDAGNPVHKPIVGRLPVNTKLSNGEIVSTRQLSGGNPFASTEPVKKAAEGEEPDPSASTEALPSDAVNRDVINLSQPTRIGRRGNPFAGPSQK